MSKFYLYARRRPLPGDIRDRIDAMKNRVDFVTALRRQPG